MAAERFEALQPQSRQFPVKTFRYPAARFLHGQLETIQLPDGYTRAQRVNEQTRNVIGDSKFRVVSERSSGIRIVASSCATRLTLSMAETVTVIGDAAPPPDGLFDIHVNGEYLRSQKAPTVSRRHVDAITGQPNNDARLETILDIDELPSGHKNIEVWFPSLSTTDIKNIRADDELRPVRRPATMASYGSSITQGVGVAHPSNAWPSILSSRLNLDLWNLGMGGSAHLDPAMAMLIRDAPLDLRLVTLEVGINIVNTDSMNERVFRSLLGSFIDIIRERRPAVPIHLISPFGCPIHETAAGPTITVGHDTSGRPLFGAAPSDRAAGLNLQKIRLMITELHDERFREDSNLHHIAGLEIFPPSHATPETVPDNLHPADPVHRAIAAAMIPHIQTTLS